MMGIVRGLKEVELENEGRTAWPLGRKEGIGLTAKPEE